MNNPDGTFTVERVTFDPKEHTYDEGRLPSVTQILSEAGLIKKDFYTPEGRERGKAVHMACQFYDEGDLDLESVDPSIRGYLDAYVKWHRELGLKPDWIEIPIGGKLYAGTPDRIMLARPRALIELKTGTYQSWHRLQSAAYVNLLKDPFSYGRFGLYLHEDASYSMKPFPKEEYILDLNAFLSCLNIVNWRRSHNGS